MDLDRLSKNYDIPLIIKNINNLKIIKVAEDIGNGCKVRESLREHHISRQTINRTLGGTTSLYFMMKGNPNYKRQTKNKPVVAGSAKGKDDVDKTSELLIAKMLNRNT